MEHYYYKEFDSSRDYFGNYGPSFTFDGGLENFKDAVETALFILEKGHEIRIDCRMTWDGIMSNPSGHYYISDTDEEMTEGRIMIYLYNALIRYQDELRTYVYITPTFHKTSEYECLLPDEDPIIKKELRMEFLEKLRIYKDTLSIQDYKKALKGYCFDYDTLTYQPIEKARRFNSRRRRSKAIRQ